MKKTYLEEVEERKKLDKIPDPPKPPPCRIIKEDTSSFIFFCFIVLNLFLFLWAVFMGIFIL